MTFNSTIAVLSLCLISLCFQLGIGAVNASDTDSNPHVIVVVGALGSDEFAEDFEEVSDFWHSYRDQNKSTVLIDGESKESNKEAIVGAISNAPKDRDLYVIMFGHGTVDAEGVAKFNLQGPDVSASELNDLLPLERRSVIVAAFSCSAGFLETCSAPNRIIISATRSSAEQNFSRFGKYFSKRIIDESSDIDHDSSVSVLEAFLSASQDVTRFYEESGRLATEHAILDDNGDRRGTSADFFKGIRVVKRTKDQSTNPDGLVARQTYLKPPPDEAILSDEMRAKVNSIERAIEDLRQRKSELSEEAYYKQLEQLLLDLAGLLGIE